ncbi:hypothetical protein BDP67DRAFT_616023 [Colletotrichum lupini]|nr:hypothetical protein BDP67DRAFT_616023 [Colletotrichum lupini]
MSTSASHRLAHRGSHQSFPNEQGPFGFPSRYPRITSHCRPVVRSRRRRRYHLSLALHRIHDPHIHRRCAMTGLSELRTKCTLQYHVIVRSGLAQQNGTPLSKPLSLQVLAPFAPPLPARRPLYPHPDLHLLQLPCKRSEKSPTPPQPKEGR